jgi:large subunit ribosomal protein L10
VAPGDTVSEPAIVRAFHWEFFEAEMNKEQKAEQVREIAEALSESVAVFAVDYRGISVPQAADLRTRLLDVDASFKVVKNRLAKLAVDETKVDGITDLLEGPTALTLIKGDPVVAAKALSNFARENNVLVFKGGIMEGRALAPDEFVAIARLPAVEILRGQLVGLTASPLTGLAAGLNNLISGLGRQLAQMADQGLVSGEAPPDEPQARTEEEPAEEEPQTAPEEAAEEADGAETSEKPEDEKNDNSPEGVEGEAETSEGPEDESSPEAVEGEAETSEGEEEESASG